MYRCCSFADEFVCEETIKVGDRSNILKKALGIITASLLASLMSTSTALAANWLQVAESQHNGRASIDVNSVQRQGPFVRYWTLIEFSIPDEYGNTAEVSYKTTDCRNGNSKLRHLLFYNGNRVTTDYTYGENTPVQQVVPGSVGESIFQSVCSY